MTRSGVLLKIARRAFVSATNVLELHRQLETSYANDVGVLKVKVRSVSTAAGTRKITLSGDVLLAHGEETDLQQAMVSSNVTSSSVVCLRIYRHFPALRSLLVGRQLRRRH